MDDLARGNVVEAGHVELYRRPDGSEGRPRPLTVPFSILVQFPDEETFRRATRAGRTAFTLFDFDAMVTEEGD